MKKEKIYYSKENKYNINQSTSYKSPEYNIHAHDSYELYYFISGDVTYYIEGQGYQIKSNDLLLINNKELHKPVFNSNEAYERIVVHFNPKYIKSLNYDKFSLLDCFENRKTGKSNLLDSKDVIGNKLDSKFKELIGYIVEDAPEAEIMIDTTFLQILLCVNKVYQKQKISVYNKNYDKKIMEIINYINNNLHKKITLKKLENKFYLSKYYLCHLFKKNTGFTVMQYITYKRILKAKEMLSTGKSCSETCNQLGFGDYSNFYKIFKKNVGISPIQFLNKNKF
ncbi:helix-turn-helix domain-containing protein [Natronospora cellulosivora (SeqCode)]